MDLLREIEGMNHAPIETKKRFLEFLNSTSNPSDKGETNHITGSAWIVDTRRRKVLLTHHRKLNIWIQPGGHPENELDPLLTAKREAIEETNLNIEPLSTSPFYIDIFKIPSKGCVKSHLHYDITYIFQVTGSIIFKVSSESIDLKWIELTDIVDGGYEENIVNMAKLTLKREMNGR